MARRLGAAAGRAYRAGCLGGGKALRRAGRRGLHPHVGTSGAAGTVRFGTACARGSASGIEPGQSARNAAAGDAVSGHLIFLTLLCKRLQKRHDRLPDDNHDITTTTTKGDTHDNRPHARKGLAAGRKRRGRLGRAGRRPVHRDPVRAS
ncbi:putative Predicted protein [Cupriavidus taiwanensis]|nr:putative Predicted protein [Cupriavidus taiwanensis]